MLQHHLSWRAYLVAASEECLSHGQIIFTYSESAFCQLCFIKKFYKFFCELCKKTRGVVVFRKWNMRCICNGYLCHHCLTPIHAVECSLVIVVWFREWSGWKPGVIGRRLIGLWRWKFGKWTRSCRTCKPSMFWQLLSFESITHTQRLQMLWCSCLGDTKGPLTCKKYCQNSVAS